MGENFVSLALGNCGFSLAMKPWLTFSGILKESYPYYSCILNHCKQSFSYSRAVLWNSLLNETHLMNIRTNWKITPLGHLALKFGIHSILVKQVLFACSPFLSMCYSCKIQFWEKLQYFPLRNFHLLYYPGRWVILYLNMVKSIQVQNKNTSYTN